MLSIEICLESASAAAPTLGQTRKTTRSTAGFANTGGLVHRWRLPSGLDREALPPAPTWLRWQSLLGVVPLAGYLLLHLGAQSLALWDRSFERWLHGTERHPLARALGLGL